MLRLLPLLALLAASGCAALVSRDTADVDAAYRTLLAEGEVASEYGWICEYSTAGLPPKQRRAVLTLIEQRRTDLLQRALRSHNIESRVYAADALIYLDHRGYPMPSEDQALVSRLRASADTVRTCGNMGSYRIYPFPVHEVLTDSAVAEIDENYRLLAEIGWFDPHGI